MPKILLVDDDPGVLLTYQAILELKGYEVMAAASTREARAALERDKFQLLLCDLSFKAGRDGFHVIEEARELQPSIVPILMTGLLTDEVVAQAEARNIAVVFKPVDPQTLLTTLSDLLSTHKAGQAAG